MYIQTLRFFLLLFVSVSVWAAPQLDIETKDENGVRWLYFVLSSVEEAYGVDLEVSYEHKDVQVVDVNNNLSGVQVSRGALLGEQAYEISNYVDSRKGVIRIASSILHPAEPVSGRGAVAVIGFRSASGKPAKIHVSRLQLGDKDGQLISAVFPEAILVEPAHSLAVSEKSPLGAYVPGSAVATSVAPVSQDNLLLYIIAGLLAVVILLLGVVLLRKPKAAV